MSSQYHLSLSKLHRHVVLLLLSLVFLLPSHCSAACFTPNGTEINIFNGWPENAVYAPCNNETSASMCCATGPLRGSPDKCFEDGSGLCYNKNVGGTAHFWRESCTDPTWRDPACVKLFTNGTDTEYWSDRELKQCIDGSYCDLSNGQEIATACCEAGQGLVISVVNGQVIIESPNSASTSIASTAFSSTTSTSTSVSNAAVSTSTTTSRPDPSSSDRGLSTGAKAGIGIGVALGALAAFALLGWCILVKRKGKEAQPEYSTSNDGPKELPPDGVYKQPTEMEHPGGGTPSSYHQYTKLRPELAGDAP